MLIFFSTCLQPSQIFTSSELEFISCRGTGGEGKEHKAIKEYVYNHTESVGVKSPLRKEKEYPLPSGDRLDVYFETADNRIAIEVKPSTSPDDDITRGIFQCVKYMAVMEAVRKIDYSNTAIDAILVTPRVLSGQNKQLADALGVVYIENFDINS